MPDFPLIDSHVHFWDPAVQPYPWLDDIPALRGRRTPAEFRAAAGPVAVAKIVFVQCGAADALAEVAWIERLAGEEPRVAGIVAHAPLEQGEAAAPWLERLAARPLVKGVRRLLQDESDDAFCLRPDFVRAVRLLPRHGFSCDLCIFHRQLANVVRLVRQCPEVRFVLDHLGKPGIRASRLDPWRAELRELAALPNVWCKLSGMVTEADHARWTPADLRPYVDHAFACFGADRMMFGSDWPVSTLAAAYPRWVATVDEALRGASADELQRIFVRTAEAFYRV
jgi:L-fuconolactonase